MHVWPPADPHQLSAKAAPVLGVFPTLAWDAGEYRFSSGMIASAKLIQLYKACLLFLNSVQDLRVEGVE